MSLSHRVTHDPRQNPQTPGTSPRQVRPPFDGQRMPLPGVSDTVGIRRTAQQRSEVKPIPISREHGYQPTDPYIRRYWVAAIGPGAVADLLRLAAAAQRGRSLPVPTHLDVLLREGLVARMGDVIGIPTTFPQLPLRLRGRLPPRLVGELVAGTRHRKAV